MPISFTISNDNVDLMLDDLRRMFPTLTTGSPLPPMQEQPIREPAPPVNDNPKPERKPRAKKADEAAKQGESVDPLPTDAAASSTATEEPVAGEKAEIPDIDAVRNALKTLGSTDGFGHDKVFEVLGKYKATNASSVPEDKRAELIAEIEKMLKEGK